MENYQGIAVDPRSEEEKSQDYKHSDIFGTEVIWSQKKIEDLKHYTPRNQSTSLSCCGQGSAKGVETLINKVMSAHPPYRSRSNYPDGGMYVADIGAVWKKIGSNLESDDKSQNLGESGLNRDITVPTPYKIKGYIQPNAKSIDEIAQAVETYGHCMLIFHAHGTEWTKNPVYNGGVVNFGHCICAVDYFLDENKVKCLYIEDSAGITSTMDGQHRVITEDYLKARCEGAIYFLAVNPLELPYIFTKILKIGSIGFDVKKLQEKLGLKTDGIFGEQTKAAVVAFQLAHGLSPDGVCGKNTNSALNLE
jgi:peptidoglycan hydrolase-like protein with peptidoglycan-binding domain